MNKSYVLDSSVYVKLLVFEKDSERVEALFAKIISDENYILVPSLFLYEVIGVFKKYGYSQVLIEEFLNNYYYNPCIKVFELQKEIVSQALTISEERTEKSGFPTFYDASYHALALFNQCDFITADKRYYEKAKHFGNIKLLDEMLF